MSDAICRLIQLDAAERHPQLLAQVEAIFWQTSARTIAAGPERDAFRERWLGRYMRGGSDVVLLALAGEDTVAGYLVGALENPAEQERFADVGSLFSHLLPQPSPSHLHINLPSFPPPAGGGGGPQVLSGVPPAPGGRPGPRRGGGGGGGVRRLPFYARCAPPGAPPRRGGRGWFSLPRPP